DQTVLQEYRSISYQEGLGSLHKRNFQLLFMQYPQNILCLVWKYMQTGSSSSKYILAYDANCGPCTRFRHIVDIFDKYEKIDFISLSKADQEGLLDKIPVHQRYKSFHLIFPKGETKSGSEALFELIMILPGGKITSPIINYFPGGKKAVRFYLRKIFNAA
ncbi:MAG: DCC1-like thiol-disulfide oxidoreductase family protein, partial [Candidatus Nitrosopolaris sp.]